MLRKHLDSSPIFSKIVLSVVLTVTVLSIGAFYFGNQRNLLTQIATGIPKGFHDGITCAETWGWTCDPDNYAQSLWVHLYEGPTFLGAALANRSRELAVGQACGNGTSAHGFVWPIPASLKNGLPHTIYAYAINIGAGTSNPLLTLSPRTITCAGTGGGTGTIPTLKIGKSVGSIAPTIWNLSPNNEIFFTRGQGETVWLQVSGGVVNSAVTINCNNGGTQGMASSFVCATGTTNSSGVAVIGPLPIASGVPISWPIRPNYENWAKVGTSAWSNDVKYEVKAPSASTSFINGITLNKTTNGPVGARVTVSGVSVTTVLPNTTYSFPISIAGSKTVSIATPAGYGNPEYNVCVNCTGSAIWVAGNTVTVSVPSSGYVYVRWRFTPLPLGFINGATFDKTTGGPLGARVTVSGIGIATTNLPNTIYYFPGLIQGTKTVSVVIPAGYTNADYSIICYNCSFTNNLVNYNTISGWVTGTSVTVNVPSGGNVYVAWRFYAVCNNWNGASGQWGIADTTNMAWNFGGCMPVGSGGKLLLLNGTQTIDNNLSPQRLYYFGSQVKFTKTPVRYTGEYLGGYEIWLDGIRVAGNRVASDGSTFIATTKFDVSLNVPVDGNYHSFAIKAAKSSRIPASLPWIVLNGDSLASGCVNASTCPTSGGDTKPPRGSGARTGTPRYIGVGTPYIPSTVTVHINGLPSILNNLQWRVRLWPYNSAGIGNPISQTVGTGKGDAKFNIPAGQYDLTITYYDASDNSWSYIDSSSDFDAIRHICTNCFDHPTGEYSSDSGTFSMNASPFADVSVYVVPLGGTITDKITTIYMPQQSNRSFLGNLWNSIKSWNSSLFDKNALAQVIALARGGFKMDQGHWYNCQAPVLIAHPSASNGYLGFQLFNYLNQAISAWRSVGSRLQIPNAITTPYDIEPSIGDGINQVSVVTGDYQIMNSDGFIYTLTGEGAAGMNVRRFSGSDILLETDTYMRKGLIDGAKAALAAAQGKPYNAAVYYTNVLNHEIGHSLGLDESLDINSVMYQASKDNEYIQNELISPDDRNALNYDYATCP